MGLESATYISGLNSANPTSSDAKTQGDDHIRLVKSALLATFPNITGAVTPTHTTLNNVLSSSSWAMNSNRLTNPGNTQPAFHAINSSPQQSGTTLVFDSEYFDHGGNYNTSNGVFTAPIDGIYQFNANVMCKNSTGSNADFSLLIYKNGSNTNLPWMVATNVLTSYGASLNIHILMKLVATDYVYVGSNTTLTVTRYFESPSSFSGFLVC